MTTTRERTYATEGVVVRQSDLGEADRLITLITPDRGIVRAVGRSARRPASKVGSHVDLLRRVSLSMRIGRSIDSIAQAETLESFASLHQTLELTARAFYIAELVERFSVEDAPGRAVFDLLLEGLRSLENAPDPDLLVRWFEMRLLRLTGFQPELRKCVDCGDELQPEEHTYSAARGGVVCPRCRSGGSDVLTPTSIGALKLMRHLERSEFPQVAGLRVSAGQARQVERVLRAHIVNVLDRTVSSAAFLDTLKRWGNAGAVRPSNDHPHAE